MFNVNNHRWTQARAAAKKRDKRCVTCGSEIQLEVNHVVPIVGAGYGWSCRNHQDNLQVLCHLDHVIVTNQQAAMRRLNRESA